MTRDQFEQLCQEAGVEHPDIIEHLWMHHRPPDRVLPDERAKRMIVILVAQHVLIAKLLDGQAAA